MVIPVTKEAIDYLNEGEKITEEPDQEYLDTVHMVTDNHDDE